MKVLPWQGRPAPRDGAKVGRSSARRSNALRSLVESLEGRHLLSFIGSVSAPLTAGQLVGDTAADLLSVHGSGGDLIQDGTAGGGGSFADSLDFDSSTAGSQHLLAAPGTTLALVSGGSDRFEVGAEGGLGGAAVVASGSATSTLTVDDPSTTAPNPFTVTATRITANGIDVTTASPFGGGVTVDTGLHQEPVTVLGTAAGQPLTVTGRNGNVVNIGDGSTDLTSTLRDGLLVTGLQTNLIFTPATTSAGTYSLGGGSLQGVAAAGVPVGFNDLGNLSLIGGNGGNTFNISDTPALAGSTTISTGLGTNTVNLHANSSSLAIANPGGTDQINIGTPTTPPSLAGGVVVSASGGSTAIKLDDSGLPANPNGADVTTLMTGNDGTSHIVGPVSLTFPVTHDTSLTYLPGAGATTLRLDISSDNPIPDGGLNYLAGVGQDDLHLLSSNSQIHYTDETQDATDGTAGDLNLDGSVIHTSGVRSIVDSLTAANFTFNDLTSGNANLSLGFGPNTEQGQPTTLLSSLSSPSPIEPFAYADKANVLINTGPGDDTLAITGLALPGTTTVDGQAGNNTLNYDAGGNLVSITPAPGDPGAGEITSPFTGTVVFRNFAHVNIINGTIQGPMAAPPIFLSMAQLRGVAGTPLVGVDVATFDSFAPGSTYTASIDWGDGTPATAGIVVPDASDPTAYHVEGSHLYQDSGRQPLTVTVNQVTTGTSIVAGTSFTTTSRATASTSPGAVISDAPLAGVGNSLAPVAGTPITATLATFSYPSGLSTPSGFGGLIAWGDGTSTLITASMVVEATSGSSTTFAVVATHAYSSPGAFSIGVTLTSAGGGSGYAATTATVADATLTDASPAAPLSTVEGTQLSTVIGIFRDPNLSATASNFAASVNFGDGHITPGIVTAAPSNPGQFFITSTNTFARAGTFQAMVSVADIPGPGGSTLSFFRTISVLGANLQEVGSDLKIYPFVNIPFTGTLANFTSTSPTARASDFAATIFFVDNSSSVLGPFTPTVGVVTQGDDGSFSVSGSHTYNDSSGFGGYPVYVGIRNLATGETIDIQGAAYVSDAPVIGQGTTLSAVAGTPLTQAVVATFTYGGSHDFGEASPFTGTINWGDGTLTTIDLSNVSALGYSATGQTYVVTGNHTYESFGQYPITVTLNAAGSSGVSSGTARVADALTVLVPTITPQANGTYSGVVGGFREAGTPGPVSKYAATINWGDGSAAVPGTIVAEPDGSFLIFSTHTFTSSASFPVSVTVTNDLAGITTGSAASPVVYVPPVPVITVAGQLDPASDSGVSSTDAITNVNRPRFFGTATPGVPVFLIAIPSSGFPTTELGSTVADASGAWSITSITLPDGKYDVVVLAGDSIGQYKAIAAVVLGANQPDLTIDTVAPKVASLQFEPLTGRVVATFQDSGTGLNQAALVDGANYSFQFLGKLPGVSPKAYRAGSPLAPSYVVTGLSTTAPLKTTDPQAVVVSVDNNQPLRGGFYRITIKSGGIDDLAGNALDGTFYGYFPSGEDSPGGDFVANLTSVHNTVLPALPVGSTASPLTSPGVLPSTVFIPTVHATKIKIVGALNSVVALPGQDFPVSTVTARSKAKVKAVHTTKAHVASAHHAHDAALAHLTVKKATKARKA